MICLTSPGAERLDAFLARQAGQPFSYPAAHSGITRALTRATAPPGFDFDHNRVRLGSGPEVQAAAAAAVAAWRMFPPGWTRIHPAAPPIAGATVAVVIRFLGLHWVNPARVVYVLDGSANDRGAGFAYGTLPEHAESGEECFSVRCDPDGSVWYDLRAFSRARFPPARLAYPLTRWLQRRFARDSMAAMVGAVTGRDRDDGGRPPCRRC